MVEKMYGSIHTHFEDSFDAVNDFNDAILQFILQGTVKVAATGHGVFSEYEDIRDAISEARALAQEVRGVLKDIGLNADDALVKEPDGRIHPNFIAPNFMADNISNDEIKEFVKKIGVTGHLSSEDEDYIVNDTKAKYLALWYISMVEQFDIVPGVEAYFEDDKSHMILIAKDYEGYQSLSKIISQSNVDYKNDCPITTLKNLQDNVNKGHVICTSACIAGAFGKRLFLNEYELRTKIENIEKQLADAGYNDKQKIVDLRDSLKEIKKPTKAEYKAALRLEKKENDSSKREELDLQQKIYDDAQEKLLNSSFADEVSEAEKVLKKNSRTNTSLSKYKEKLDELLSKKDTVKEECLSLYKALEDIFGKENYYFELQNHGLDKEDYVYSNLVSFAYEVGNPNFVASNDIHVCKTKGETTEEKQEYEDALIKRNVAKCGRFKKYEPLALDDREYVIKSDDEIKEELLKLSFPSDISNKNDIINMAIGNIKGILSQCDIQHPKHQNHYPKLSNDENQLFDELVEKGINRIFPNGVPKEYRERLDYEKDVIKKMGYAGYHLIVQDYLAYGRLLGYLDDDEIEDAPDTIEELEKYVDERHPKRLGIGIGPGRGSAAGSLCCYALNITNIDPLKYNLLFERFLNTERISMPDIDSDFKTTIREKCYEYVKKKFGEECVCKVMTKTYLALKGAIQRSASYLILKESYELGLPNNGKDSEINKKYQYLQKMLSKECDSYIDEGKSEYEILQILSTKYNSNDANTLSKEYVEAINNILFITSKITNMFTVYGKHAAGVIISKDSLWDIMPIKYDDEDNVFTSQCSPAQAEEKGLLKMDFLGLKNLNIITDIMKTPGKEDYELMDVFNQIDSDNTILDNPEIFKHIFHTGFTQGIFQCESPGIKKMIQNFQPETKDDIILLLAAYRPGPMDYIPEMIAQKWYRKDPEHYYEIVSKMYSPKEKKYKNLYPTPKSSISLKNETLDKILMPTYGCPIYQEQIMEIFREMAGYSFGQADVVRRYMSKKKADKLAYEKEAFIYGDEKRGIPGIMNLHNVSIKEADDLFEQMMPFAKYGFNKSHAACYAKITIITAYQKHKSPIDFYKCSINAMESIKDVTPYIKEAKNFGISVLPPSIMKSENDFTVVPNSDKKIRYGFSFIKGIGSLDISKRTTSLCNFIFSNPNVTLANIKTLAKVGCFDRIITFKDIELNEKQKSVFSRKDMIDFVEKYGDSIRSFVSEKKNRDSLLKQLEESVKLNEDVCDLEKQISKTNDSIEKLKNKLAPIRNEILEAVEHYEPLTPSKVKARNQEAVEYENELLAYTPSTQRSIELLEDELKFPQNSKDYNNTFEMLEQKDKGKIRIRASVLDGGADKIYYTKPKKDLNGKEIPGNPYHLVRLIDSDGNEVTRRFKDVVMVDAAWFDLYVDNDKFFIQSSKDVNTVQVANVNNQQVNSLPGTAKGTLMMDLLFENDKEESEEYDFE